MSENLKLVLSNDLYYLTSDEPINCHDLVFDGVDVFLYEDNRSLLGLKKVLANEFDLGFVSIEQQERLFEVKEIKQPIIVPINNSFLDAIIKRGGECKLVGEKDEKFIISY